MVVGGRRLLGGLVTREIAMRLVAVDVNVAAAVNGIVVTDKQWQPPRRASDALLLLNALCTLRCSRVERRTVCEALGRVSRASRLEGLLHGSEVLVRPALLIVGRVGPAAEDSLGSAGSDLCRG